MIKTIIPQLCDINLASSKSILEKYSNYLQILGSFLNEVETALQYRDTFFYNNSIEKRIIFFNKLQKNFDKFSDDFCSYWFEIFKSNPEYIKNKVNLESLLFESDSVGKFSNSYYLLDDSVCPISDWSMNAAPPPSYIPYNATNKLSPWTKQIIERASFRTNNMYRSNITLVQPNDSSSLQSKCHGTNLVTDEGYFTRTVSEIKKLVVDKLIDSFKNEIKILLRYCNINDNEAINYQDYNVNFSNVDTYVFNLDIERVTQQVDLLSDKIHYLKSRIINDEVLSTEKISTINLKNRSTEQLDKLYKNNLITRLDDLDPRTFFSSISKEEKTNNKVEEKVKKDSNLDKESTEVTNQETSNQAKTEGEDAAQAPTSFTHYDSTIPYPSYQSPSWGQEISNCLGIGCALNIFNGAKDPLSNIGSDSEDFDLFAELSKLNPFNISFEPDSNTDMTSLLDSINGIDFSQISNLFSSSFPIPPFNLGSFFDNPGILGDSREDALKKATDSLLDTLEQQTQELLNGLVCGTAQSFGING